MNEKLEPARSPWPQSIAIAGAWGYIGRKFLDAALQLGIRPSVFDPGPPPADVPAERIERFTDEDAFYRQPAGLFHLALQPAARQRGLSILFDRGRSESIAILNEKPMAAPEHPEHCRQLIEALENSSVLMLFDFLELFSPMTESIVRHLSQFREVSIQSIEMQRSKDREDPGNPRNYKTMAPIQFQESVHCLAWVLFLLARLRGNLAAAFNDGLRITAEAEPYAPPNPQDYPYVVDGRCVWRFEMESTQVTGRTDFKRSAPWTKRRVVRGTADGQPFEIEAEYLEGHKRLIIDGVDQHVDPQSNSYVDVIQTFARWQREVDRKELTSGIYPNARFAHTTYQLSSALWRASRESRPIELASYQALLGFDSQFATEVPRFGRYA